MAVGAKFGYSEGVPETIPSNMTLLNLVSAINAPIRNEQDCIDVGEIVSVTVHATESTKGEWKRVFKASEENGGVWFEVYHPYLKDGVFFFAKTPTEFPLPKTKPNELEAFEIPLTVVKYAGFAERIEPQSANMT